ncbi:hypothetical protein [Streptomyces sp. NPDC088794]|uniref:hypothetical protein n=1 Tax=Streptomyces sp. NPDC088794 TaxID=3365902 RepID=UPI003825A2CB
MLRTVEAARKPSRLPGHGRRSGRLQGVTALLCAGLLTGCTAGAAATGEQPPPASAGVQHSADLGLLLPLDAYRAAPGEQFRIDRAYATLFQRCMKRFGWSVRATSATGSRFLAEPNRDRYMLTDARAASTRGYHPPQKELDAARKAAASESGHQSTAYLTAASGKGAAWVKGRAVPPGGCSGQAANRLTTAEEREAQQLVENLRGWSWSRSQRDSRVTGVFDAWAACMTKAGFHYRTPMGANDDPAFAGDRPTAREISTAVADVRCKKETGVVRVWADTEAAYQNQAIEENRPALEKARKAVGRQLSAAAEVLGEGQDG